MKTWACSMAVAIGLAARGATGSLLPPMTNGSPDEFAPRRAGQVASASYKISVTNEGIYRITQTALLAAGITNPAGGQLRLFCQTNEVALMVSAPGVMGPADYALFYGVGYENYYTHTNVYWLALDDGGLRMETRDGAPLTGALAVTSRWHVVTYDLDTIYRPYNWPMDDGFDHWFVDRLDMNAWTNFFIRTDFRDTSEPALFSVRLRGLSSVAGVDPDHRTDVRIKGTVITSFLYDGHAAFSGSMTFAASLLSNGMNSVSMRQSQVGVPDDMAFLEEFSLGYLRQLRPTNNVCAFVAPAGPQNFTAGGFPSRALHVFDVTDASRAVYLTNFAVTTNLGQYSARWGSDPAGESRFLVCSTSAFRNVSLEPVVFRGLADTNRQADLIVIAPLEWRWETYRLMRHRYLQGLAVVPAPIEAVYNEFNYGLKDAAAIKQFLGYAFHHWQSPPPRHVLLIGEGNYDPRNRRGLGAPDIIPVRLGPSFYEWTAHENWYVTVNGADPLADMALGRIPVASTAQLSAVFAKIASFEAAPATNAWRKKALLVADNVDGSLNFKGSSETNVNLHLTTGGFSRVKVYLDDAPNNNPAIASNNIRTQINSGQYTVSYFGHGSIDQWSGENIFHPGVVQWLSNTVYPIFTVWTCRNGSFFDPATECLAEALLEKAGGGSVATIAPSSLSIHSSAEHLACGVYESLVNTNDHFRLGDVMNQGLLRLWSQPHVGIQYELFFYSVLGDPALLKHPRP